MKWPWSDKNKMDIPVDPTDEVIEPATHEVERTKKSIERIDRILAEARAAERLVIRRR